MTLISLIAALTWADLTWWIDVILKVSIGLGAVIFVHELGHYLVALACGVKIEKFMIGFDIGGLKLSRRWGETEYGIGILPLGGYVKMLGQDDDPAHIAEQMKKSEVSAQSENAVPIHGPDGETYYVDRRSYLAKSVPQRMAIISAGVVMNVIFAFIFAVIAYGMGVPYMPAIVSSTVPGSPAWQVGLEPGDEIVQIGNRVDPTFVQLRGNVTLGDLDEGIPVVVRRAADGEIETETLKPRQLTGRLATIGIESAQSLTLFKKPPVLENSPADRAKLVSPSTGITEEDAKLLGGDRIIRVGDMPVEAYRDFAAELTLRQDQPLLITVERTPQNKQSAESGAQARQLTFEVGPQPLQQFGMMMKMGPITAIQENSPAAKAGILVGDIMERVDGISIAAGSVDDLDPLVLPEYLRQAAQDRREVELVLRRPLRAESAGQITLRITPIVPQFANSQSPEGAPVAADALGVAYQIENVVQAVRPNSTAADANVTAGDQVTRAKIIRPKDDKGKARDPVTIKFLTDEPRGVVALLRRLFGREPAPRQPLPNWPALVDAVQFLTPGTHLELTLQSNGDSRTVKLTPQATDQVFVSRRGFLFEPITRTREAATFAEQVRYGWDETAEALTMVFRFIRKLGSQVPITALGGPVTIATVAGYSAAEGLSSLLIFLTMLSANLAVINFLPIPLLDGGHMVFLAYEGLRGRPASERFVVALHTAGFVFIVGLMLFVLALDFGLIERGL